MALSMEIRVSTSNPENNNNNKKTLEHDGVIFID